MKTDSQQETQQAAQEQQPQPVETFGGGPLEVDVDTKKAEENFNRLSDSMSKATETSQRLANGLERIEGALSRLRGAKDAGSSVTVEMMGEVISIQQGHPKMTHALTVLRQMQRGELTRDMAYSLLVGAGVLDGESAATLLDQGLEQSKRAAPAPEAVDQATKDWEAATPEEQERASTLYERLIARNGRRSAVSWTPLPTLAEAPPLVRADWLDVARHVQDLLDARGAAGTAARHQHAREEVAEKLREALLPQAMPEMKLEELITLARGRHEKLTDLESVLREESVEGEEHVDTLQRLRTAASEAAAGLPDMDLSRLTAPEQEKLRSLIARARGAEPTADLLPGDNGRETLTTRSGKLPKR